MNHWLEAARSSLNAYKPGMEKLPGVGTPLPPSALPTDPDHHGLPLHNTITDYEEKRHTSVIMINSLDRDQQVYPLPTQMRLKLPRVYKNVERIDIVQIKFFCGLYAISAANKNNTLLLQVGATSYPIVVADGTYTLQQLMTALAVALNAAGSARTFSVSYGQTTGRITVTATGGSFALLFLTGLPLYAQAQDIYSEWGLGWNLGFGGPPLDLSGAASYTGGWWPRLSEDYIYLQMNEFEHMNEVDHTSLENTAKAQDSTGQVSHYFGKLLLNHFGCWAQTFVEAPKTFKPVLGRLERLQFLWTNRHGVALAGPDAATCDWHMTVRITEIVEAPSAISTLRLGSNSVADK